MLLASYEQFVIGDRNRNPTRFADRIRTQYLVLWAGLDHKRVAVVAGDQDLAIKGNRLKLRAVKLPRVSLFSYSC